MYDASLRAAFDAADSDATGALSKRQLYSALTAVGLKTSQTEDLAIWKQFDYDGNGRVEFEEFRLLGAALLAAMEADAGVVVRTPAPRKQDPTGFAQRTQDETAKVKRTSAHVKALARKRSMDRLREGVRSLRDGTWRRSVSRKTMGGHVRAKASMSKPRELTSPRRKTV